LVGERTPISARRHRPETEKRELYDRVAYDAIVDLLEREHAVTWLEIEAKLADRPYFDPLRRVDTSEGINPHHLSNARAQLKREGRTRETVRFTRGRYQPIATVSFAEQHKIATAVNRSAARKRLLQARYLGWTRATKERPSPIGRGGEAVVHASLREAARAGVGYLVVQPEGGEVARLFGADIPGGPLDNAAYLTCLTPEGRPTLVTVPIEVKNVREWIYPTAAELFQLLDKAARLQLEHPETGIVPLLVCRRAQFTTFTMARELGFRIQYTLTQPIQIYADIPARHLDEVNDELGYNLVPASGPHAKLTELLTRSLPAHAAGAARRWAKASPVVARYSRQLRDPALPDQRRNTLMRHLRIDAARELEATGEWLTAGVLEAIESGELDEYE
jgi:hypothetical protein